MCCLCWKVAEVRIQLCRDAPGRPKQENKLKYELIDKNTV